VKRERDRERRKCGLSEGVRWCNHKNNNKVLRCNVSILLSQDEDLFERNQINKSSLPLVNVVSGLP
jgi:hypothetical protein